MKCFKNIIPWSFRILAVLFFFLILLCSPSCKSSKDASVSEDELISQIDSVENQRSEAEAKAQILRDSIANLPQGFRYTEDRSVDPQRQPVVLHFVDSLPKREFKLSELADELKYIVLKASIDSTLNHAFASIVMGKNFIVYYGLQGIELFNIDGTHSKTIVRNQGVSFKDGRPTGYRLSELIGHPNFEISSNNDTFYYCLYNGPAGSSSILEVNPDEISGDKALQEEIPAINHAEGKAVKEFDTSILSKRGLYSMGNGLWGAMDRKWNSGTSGDLFTLYGPSGDTLCQFTDFDRIADFPGGPNRKTERGFGYNFKGTLSLKPAHNDTLFRILPPNRLLPTYVFDFGERKVGSRDGAIPGNDLSDKNMAYDLHETDKFLYFYYSRNHIIYRNIRSGNYKYFYTLIDKNDHQVYQINSDESKKGRIVNDIDNGLPFWPDGVTEDGIPYMYITGKNFKEESSRRIDGLEDNDILIILAK